MGASAAAKKTFNPDAVVKAMLLNDTSPVDGKGHCSMVIVDENGYSRLYTFQQGGLWKQTNTPAETQQLLKDGLIPHTPSQFQFKRIIEFKITNKEGRRMYDYAENHEFKKFYKRASFYKPIGMKRNTDNCVTVVRAIMFAGSRKYKFFYPFGVPNYAFTAMKWRLFFRRVPYKIYYPKLEVKTPA